MRRLLTTLLLVIACGSYGQVPPEVMDDLFLAVTRSFSSAEYPVTGGYFDGSNDYTTRGARLDTIADGKTGLLSVWLRMDPSSSDTTAYYVMSNVAAGGSGFYCRRTTGGKIAFIGLTEAPVTILWIEAATSILKTSGWVHILASWDLSTAGRRYVILNGVDDTAVTTFTTGSDIDYDRVASRNWSVGALTGGSSKFYGDLAEVYFTTEYLDLSVAANILKFRTATGHPANLGADGSTPTGTQPLLYFHNAWDVNSGSGGNFTITGTITASSSNP